jgi:2-succinyl-5-enolpyruvyl-6-hydroxy-3-cyclohexene-1-carboxylate synthase
VNKKSKIYLDTIPFSDFKVLKSDSKSAKNSQLQISNSSAIRYAQLTIDPSIEVYCNRGTSGIDGSTSTAIGAAVNGKQTVFITGDIFYMIAMPYGTITFQKL